jgi:thioredoxin reductase
MYDVVIVGAGIAGCTAAIYASRRRMNYLLVSENFGGQFSESSEILNYPGIIKTDGVEFRSTLEKQMEFNNVKPVIGEKITAVKREGDNFVLSNKNRQLKAKSVVVTVGSRPKKLGVPGETEYANKGVTYCSICDGPLFAQKTIAIIGGGNSALEGVDFTKNIASKIYLINIGSEFNAHQYLIDKIASYNNVEIINEAQVSEIYGDKFVKGLKYQKQGKINELSVDGIIVEAGRSPNTSFLNGFLELNAAGHIQIDCQTRTSQPGVFAAGDCASAQEYQYIVAAGQGCVALLKASRYLANRKIN